MGTNKTPGVGAGGKLQGILIPDSRVQNSTIQDASVAAPYGSSFTQQGAMAGVPDPAQRSNMVVKASGPMTAGESFTLEARTAGHPLPSKGSFIWHDDKSSDSFDGRPLPYGHDGYQVVTGYDGVRKGYAYTGGDVFARPSIVRMHHDQILANWMEHRTSPSVAYVPTWFLYDPQTGLWTKTSHSEHYAKFADSAMIVLPSGRVITFFVAGVLGGRQISSVFSDDNGGSWAPHATSSLQTDGTSLTIASGIDEIAVGYSAGVVLLLVGGGHWDEDDGLMEQYISYDLGCTFTRVGSEFKVATTTWRPFSPTIQGLDDGTFYVAIGDAASSLPAGTAKYRGAVIDPAQPFYNQSGGYLTIYSESAVDERHGTVSVWRDEDRLLYMLVNTGGNTNVWGGFGYSTRTNILRSEDSGRTWMEYASEGVINQLNAHCVRYAANSIGGRAIMLGHFDHDQWFSGEAEEGAEHAGFDDRDKVSIIYLGGHARQTVCSVDSSANNQQFFPTDMMGWGTENDTSVSAREGRCWLPMDLPDECGWTETTAGTFTAAKDPGGTHQMKLTTSGGGSGSFLIEEAVGYGNEVVATVAILVTVVSGGDRTAGASCGLNLRVTNFKTAGSLNATFNYSVKLALDTTGMRLVEIPGLSTMVDVAFDMTKPTWIYICVGSPTNQVGATDGECALFYGRAFGDGTDGLATQRRQLTPAIARTGVPNQALSGGVHLTDKSLCQWGHLVGTDDATSLWGFVGHSVTGSHFAPSYYAKGIDDWIGGSSEDPEDVRSHLNGREWPSVPSLLVDEVRISAGDGPAREQDKWTITPRYDYGIENADPANNASPRVPWRSAEETAGSALTEQTIVWRLEDKHNAWSLDFGNHAFGIVLMNCNFKTAFLERYNGGAWSTLAELDASVDLGSLTYARNGSIILPNRSVAASAPKWIHRDELVGSTLDLGAGGSGTARYKHIRGNTEGGWSSDGSGTSLTRLPRIMYETSELSASDPTSHSGGNAAVWRKNMGAVVYNFDPLSTVAEPVLRLRIPAQANADGYFQIGSIIIGEVAVFGTQFDRGLSWTTMPNVQDYQRPDGSRRPHTLGPMRREVELAWSENAMDASRTQGGLQDDAETLPGSANSPDFVALTTAGLPVAARYDTVSQVEGILRQVGGSAQPVVFLPRLPVQAGSSGEVVQFTDDRLFLYGRIDSDHRYEVVQGNEGVDEVQRLNKIVITEEV